MTAAEPVLFSESYYRRVLTEFGYEPFDLRRFDFGFTGLSPETMNVRYLCHHRGEEYLRAGRPRRIVTTGFGMSGLPHLATVSHILKMVELQRADERCQIVIGDLDAYNGRSMSYDRARELAERFRTFSIALGFDAEAGILRVQEGHLPALQAMYLLGRYVEQRDLDATEEDQHGYYVQRGLVDPEMTFRRALSLTLMAGDFVALGQDHDAVLVVLGIDEHRYVRFTQLIQSRMDDSAPLRTDFALSAAYTRMVPGFGGHPKFSKSIPGSAIDVGTEPSEVHRLLASEPPRPETSATFQLMCQTPFFDGATLRDLHEQCARGDVAWQRAVAEFADRVIELMGRWPQ